MSKFNAYEALKILPNPDGTITRLIKLPEAPATADVQTPGQSAISKDVILNDQTKTWARVYLPVKLPSNDQSVAKLPIVIYFHGGGWIDFSSNSAIIHHTCNNLTAEIPALVVSVAYRLAPENRLPAQYDDASDALLWVKNQFIPTSDDGAAGGGDWLREFGDVTRCYLYGVSNGGNIVFNEALRAMDIDLSPLKIAGLIMNQPMFGGEERTKSELKWATDELLPLPAVDLYWELALPPGTNRNHRYSNPMVDGPHKEKMKSIGRCLVIGFDGDGMIDRQQDLVQMLVLNGVPVEARFDDFGFHGIDMVDPRRNAAVTKFIKDFII
ncbi:probable carboxylesterase 9 [Impatiens glandulifera]|uniref:probable carboxylesterase 9 n=1 Tax=Impatiens glandulifera TaxID=253017 RepID=UPI001FB14D19|nr:probable carboxylesterase 9 [Impatiens glandulifera]